MVNLNNHPVTKGMIGLNQNEMRQGAVQQVPPVNVGQVGISDDEFFHLTCHVDANLKHRIEKGEYVEWKNYYTMTVLNRTTWVKGLN